MVNEGSFLIQLLQGNEPILLALNIVKYFDKDVILPLSLNKLDFVRSKALMKGLNPNRIFMDAKGGGILEEFFLNTKTNSTEWMNKVIINYDSVEKKLRDHYRNFDTVDLEGNVRSFSNDNIEFVMNAGGFFDVFPDLPMIYSFPHRSSEIFSRNESLNSKKFGEKMRKNEARKNRINFIPFVHTFSFDENYIPENEETTPFMKEAPRPIDLDLPENSIGMMFSGTDYCSDILEELSKNTNYNIITFLGAPGEDKNIMKIDPPYGEFVHIYQGILAVVSRPGGGTYWSAWNAGKPIIFPAYSKGDDMEMLYIGKSIKKLNLGLEFSDSKKIDIYIEKSQECIPSILKITETIKRDFNTLDGCFHVANRIKKLFL